MINNLYCIIIFLFLKYLNLFLKKCRLKKQKKIIKKKSTINTLP